MPEARQKPQTVRIKPTNVAPETDFDAIIGGGFAGLYMLHCLRGLGLSSRVFEIGSGSGGT